MLVTLNEVLKDAKEKKYGVGLFNTVNLEMAKGVLAAAEELRAPVVIGSAEVLLNCSTLKELAGMLRPMAERASVPVVLHLDHGLTEACVNEALDLGFTSIMYDCSTKPYEENVACLKSIVDKAHKMGVSVEGELGHVGANANAADGNVYTEPLEAKDFAEKTGVDALAVAIGTAHGIYKVKPTLDIERLKEIASVVDVPLVLHGGSGLSDDDFRNTIKYGISKVNIFTDINVAYAKYIHDNWTDGLGHTKLMVGATEAVKQVVMNKIKLFGSDGKY